MHSWFDEVCHDFEVEVFVIGDRIKKEHAKIVGKLPEGYTRKDFAIRAVNSPLRGHLFLYEDRRTDDLVDAIWKDVQP